MVYSYQEWKFGQLLLDFLKGSARCDIFTTLETKMCVVVVCFAKDYLIDRKQDISVVGGDCKFVEPQVPVLHLAKQQFILCRCRKVFLNLDFVDGDDELVRIDGFQYIVQG